MLFAEVVYLGIDPSAGEKPCHYAALDRALNVIGLDRGDKEQVLSYAAGIKRGAVAVDTPARLSQGLLARPEIRRSLGLSEEQRTWSQWRVAEFELRRRNIRLYRTPTDRDQAPAWMQQGIEIHRRLKQLEFAPLASKREAADRSLLEVNPQACYTVLLERRPFAKETLEGRLQRQLVLFLQGVGLANPMLALEEITRHHLLTGNLPMHMLHSHQALDALVAAFTAYLAVEYPDRIAMMGDPAEGQITLPAPTLLDFYP